MTDTECRRAFELETKDQRTDLEERWLRDHLSRCPHCRQQRLVLGALRVVVERSEPPAVGLEAAEEVLERVGRNRRGLWAGIAVAALGIAGVLVYFAAPFRNRQGMVVTSRPLNLTRKIVRRVPPRSCAPLLWAGATREWLPGETRSGSDLSSGDGTLRVALGPQAQVRREIGSSWVIRVLTGEVLFQVRPGDDARCLRVVTPEGSVQVLGTEFLVSVAGREVTVEVYRGKVLFETNRRRWVIEKGRGAIWGPGRLGEPTSVERPNWWRGPSARSTSGRFCRLEALRRLAISHPKRALAALRSCEAPRTLEAEVGLLQAEVLLRLGRARDAARLLHRLASRFRGRSAGQDALFMAGQVEMSRLRNRGSAEKTLHRYLLWYPRGRYAKDAKRLLGRLAGPSGKGP